MIYIDDKSQIKFARNAFFLAIVHMNGWIVESLIDLGSNWMVCVIPNMIAFLEGGKERFKIPCPNVELIQRIDGIDPNNNFLYSGSEALGIVNVKSRSLVELACIQNR